MTLGRTVARHDSESIFGLIVALTVAGKYWA